MTADVVIRAEGLGKKYIIGHQAERERYVALRDVIARNARNFWRTAADIARGRPNVIGDELEAFWALRDINFEVMRGEVLGVIGRNGAGKSTLLKVLSRITEPTEGRVAIRGRVASLLEVGTGFHPELTGRENIFLNGAVLGMTHAEIRRKFDEIVAFAEIERFLDTPVKRYSSGMYVRLAFAVAAHLEPEILIVDEVLAVGDAEFQKKCLGKMSEVAGHGRTVLFVSHNMAAVENLCPSSMLLDAGRLVARGPTSEVIAAYTAPARTARPRHGVRPRAPWARPWIADVRLFDGDGVETDIFPMGASIHVRVTLSPPGSERLRQPVLGVVVNHLARGPVGGVNTRMTGFWPAPGAYGPAIYECEIAGLNLLQGSYSLDVWLGDGRDDVDYLESAARFDAQERDIYGSGVTPFAHLGAVFLQPRWRFQPLDAAAETSAAALRATQGG